MSSREKDHIAQFRRDKYKIEQNGDWDKSNRLIYKDLSNAVEGLSKGLYEKETHFLFELIQNAEDNSYDNQSPNLYFHLLKNDPTDTTGSDGCLCVFNNETGFQVENIESISSVGSSTKKKIDGYIGEKA